MSKSYRIYPRRISRALNLKQNKKKERKEKKRNEKKKKQKKQKQKQNLLRMCPSIFRIPHFKACFFPKRVTPNRG